MPWMLRGKCRRRGTHVTRNDSLVVSTHGCRSSVAVGAAVLDPALHFLLLASTFCVTQSHLGENQVRWVDFASSAAVCDRSTLVLLWFTLNPKREMRLEGLGAFCAVGRSDCRQIGRPLKQALQAVRSEERRVGKECRSRW